MSENSWSQHESWMREIARLAIVIGNQQSGIVDKNPARDSYRNAASNPFVLFPSAMIDELISYVINLWYSQPLRCSDLTALLTSGRVQNFVLDDFDDGPFIDAVNGTAENLGEIFVHLSSACSNLEKFIINLQESRNLNQIIIEPALNGLLCRSLKATHVESTLTFDLRALRNCIKLETLSLNFPLSKNRIYDFLSVGDKLRPHTSLKFIKIAYGVEISPFDIAVVLKHCPKLKYINRDISKSLETLHAQEMCQGNLTQEYNIEKLILDIDVNKNKIVSLREVQIAVLTCPYLTALTVTTNHTYIFSIVRIFCNIEELQITWILRQINYTLTVQSLLEKPDFGFKLTALELNGFTEVDFSSIGMSCPNLEKLIVRYTSGYCKNEIWPTSFRKLRFLTLSPIGNNVPQLYTIIGMLYNATNLEYLNMLIGERLTDDILASILKRDGFSKLKVFCLLRCSLSMHGISWVASLPNLESFELHEVEPELGEMIKTTFNEIDPEIDVCIHALPD